MPQAPEAAQVSRQSPCAQFMEHGAEEHVASQSDEGHAQLPPWQPIGFSPVRGSGTAGPPFGAPESPPPGNVDDPQATTKSTEAATRTM
jgi:hypothetical protein